MNLSDVAAEIENRLKRITDLRTAAYHPEKINAPHAWPDLPELISYDITSNRGMDNWLMPVIVAVGLVSARASHEQLQKYIDGTGPRSIKQAIDSTPADPYASCSVVRVESCTPMIFVNNGVSYLAGEFATYVAGQGS